MRSEHENDSVKDTFERDEQRLAELGKRTVEMYVICHIFTEHLEVIAGTSCDFLFSNSATERMIAPKRYSKWSRHIDRVAK